MKLVKMSLVAAMVMGASAFAIDNVKVSGDAKLYYGTTNDWGDASLFDQASSAADTALRLGVTGDLLKGVSFGATGYAVSTLGLENNLVGGTWSGAHTADVSSNGVDVHDESWLGELWLATTMGKTTVKAGRMELDTPLAFSEKNNRSIAPNTFEGAVVINQDLPNTTLIGAYVGKGNGGYNTVAEEAKFSTFGEDGAYVAAIVNNSFKPLVAQAWYYNIENVAAAYWLQADWDCQLVKNVKVGVQYANINPDAAATHDSSAYAVKVAFDGVANLKVSAAYSSADEYGVLPIANVATYGYAYSYSQSKLYTESFLTYGLVGFAGSDSWNLTAEYDAKDIAKFGAYYTNVNNSIADEEIDEVALTASKSFGALDVRLAYINTDWSSSSDSEDQDTINAYLTLKF